MQSATALANRGNNLAALAMLAAVGIAGAFEISYEGTPLGAFDEVAILLVAVAGLAWYRSNLYARSVLPTAMLAGAFLLKIAAIVIEDADDKADDFAVVAILLVSVIVSAVIYYRSHAGLLGSAPSLDRPGEAASGEPVR